MNWGHQSKNRVNHIQGQENHSPWLNTVVDWYTLPESNGFKLTWDIDHHDQHTPFIAPLFGVSYLYVTGIVNFTMLIYIKIVNKTWYNYLTDSNNSVINDNISLIWNVWQT